MSVYVTYHPKSIILTFNPTATIDDVWLIFKLCLPPSALSAYSCSFEAGLCIWVQGAEDELDWLSTSGPTETPNTGPAGDHTTGKGPN